MININGDFTKKEISVLDQGFLYGFGLFETMRVYEGTVFSVEKHLDRLYAGAKALEWSLPWTPGELMIEIKRSVELLPCADLYLRLTVSKGNDIHGNTPPSFMILVRPYDVLPVDCYERGWSLVTVSTRKNSTSLLSRLKSLNYLDNILAKQEAKLKSADEGLFLNELGYVAEGTISNIFLSVKDTLITPSLSTGILNGITRQVVLDIAKNQGIVCEERYLTLDELVLAEEIFCTNSLLEIMPVTSLNAHAVGIGKSGPMTEILSRQYSLLVGRKS
jgi:branched-subunit amino acid aminotransferase/4-amino-4-deoxychorismate lyase